MAMEMNVSNLKVTNREEILRTPRLSVKRTSFTDGVMVGSHTTIHSNASVAVIVKKENKIALIKQFRTTTGKSYYELPAGLLESNESEVDAAVREVKEETGLKVSFCHSIVKGPSLLDPSKSDENFGVAIAKAQEMGSRNLDNLENIDSTILWMDEDEVFERLDRQQFEGEPFLNGIYMSGHSAYALLAYDRARSYEIKKENKRTGYR